MKRFEPAPPPVPFSRPCFDRRDFERLAAPLRRGCAHQGAEVERLERLAAHYTGAREAVAVCSGVAALRLALLALGAGPGHQVLMGAFGEPAAAWAVETCGARPVFGDVSPDTLALDPAEIARRASPLITTVLVSHAPGVAAGTDALLKLCRARRLPLVEDCGPALGLRYQGVHLGTTGRCGCFELGPGGAVTCGEGGLIITDDPDLAHLARLMRGGRGQEEPPLPTHGLAMSDLQGALAAAQIEKIDAVLAEWRTLARRYDELLSALWWLAPLPRAEGGGPYVCRLELPEAADLAEAGLMRQRLLALAAEAGVECRAAGRCLPGLAYFQKRYRLDLKEFPRALAAERLCLALPLYVGMSQGEQERVVGELARARERLLEERAAEPAEPGQGAA